MATIPPFEYLTQPPAKVALPGYIGYQNTQFKKLVQTIRGLRAEALLFSTSPYNVKDPAYGAVGDGMTDDRLAIQAAINACSAAGGGMVLVPTGTYALSITQHPVAPSTSCCLYMPSNVNLVGAGINATRLLTLATTPVVFNTYSIITNYTIAGPVTDVGISVQDMTIDGNKTAVLAATYKAQVGVLWWYAKNPLVRRVRFTNILSTFQVGGGIEGAAHWTNGCVGYEMESLIADAGAADFGGNGVYPLTVGGTNFPNTQGRISNCYASDATDNGFTFFRCDDTLLVNCHSKNSSLYDFNTEQSRNIRYLNCSGATSKYGFVSTFGSIGTSFNNCTAVGHTQAGMAISVNSGGMNSAFDSNGNTITFTYRSLAINAGASTTSLMTVTGTTLTANALIGKYLMVDGGANAFAPGYCALISANTTTTISLSTPLPLALVTGATVAVQSGLSLDDGNLATILGGVSINNGTAGVQHDNGSLSGVLPQMTGNTGGNYVPQTIAGPVALISENGYQQSVAALLQLQVTAGTYTTVLQNDGSDNLFMRTLTNSGVLEWFTPSGNLLGTLSPFGSVGIWTLPAATIASLSLGLVTITTSQTAAGTQTTYWLDTTAGAVTLTLPATTAVPTGKIYNVKWYKGGNAAKIAPTGTDTIEGVNATYTITPVLSAVSPQSNGAGAWGFV